jgi:CubicO group peptidase (beta-lactamase class C family)
MANYEYSVPNKPDTKFHLGSITKQFTSMAVMQLSEKGLLDVKDPLSKYIPDYPNGSKITIHQLLTHTSGIPDYINDDDTFWNISMYYHSIDSIIARFKNKKLEFKPGSKYGYSNSGYVLLAYIIEKVSGMPYESYMEKSIFAPLGMKDTGYDFCKPLVKDRASGYSLSSGRLVNADFIDSSNLKGADGLYSTAEDLHKWDSALYTEKLVSRETLNKIFTPYPPAENYGYGWIIEGSTMRHTGKMNGFYNYIGRDAKDRSVVIILSNFSRTPIDTMRKDLTAILHGESYTMPENLQQVIIDTGE